MPFTEQQRDQLMSYLGYGNVNGSTWYIGMEEAGGGLANLRARLKFKVVEDLRTAHLELLSIPMHHKPPYKLQNTWRRMCELQLMLESGNPLPTPPIDERRQYQARRLGRLGAANEVGEPNETLLLELMPIPKPNFRAWSPEYEQLFGWTRAEYYAQMGRRQQLLGTLVAKHKPTSVVCYGAAHWAAYRAIFPGRTFVPAGSGVEISRGHPVIVLTHHFASRGMNGGMGPVAALLLNP